MATVPSGPVSTYWSASSRSSPDASSIFVSSSTNSGTPSVLATMYCTTSVGRVLPPAATHLPHHDGAGVDAEPYGEVHTVLYRQAGIQGGDGLDNAQASMHRTPGIIFMGHGVAKIDEQPIAEVLGDMTFVVLDDLGSGLLVSAHHRAQVFRVELTRELCGAHQVTEQHGQLAAFGVGGVVDRCGWGGCPVVQGLGLRDGERALGGRRGRDRDGFWRRSRRAWGCCYR